MTQSSGSAASTNLFDVRDASDAPVDFEPALMIPWQSGLDPVTGLADRRWFLRAVARSDGQQGSVLIDVGIIAIRVNGLRRVIDRDGRPAGDGFLLLTAEVLYDWSRGDDLAARLGPDSFAILAHTDADGLSAAAARLREKLAEAGVFATVGLAMRTPQGSASSALRVASREAGKAGSPATPAEEVASRAIAGVRTAIAAHVLQAQATGILMQWHHCGAERARLELAYQAHEMGRPVTAMARLLVAIAAGDSLAKESTVHGIELQRSLLLAANVDADGRRRLPGSATPTTPAAGRSTGTGQYTPGRQMQPVWSVRPPNAATGLLSLPAANVSARAEDLLLAGRYQGAANPSGSGGDWFDAFVLPDGTAALVLGDVAGHDALAAATMMQLRTLLRGFAVSHEIAPSEVLRRLDRFFVQLDLGLLATAFFGWVHTDPNGGLVLRWCNAGHLPPVLLSRDGGTSVLECRDDLLLGLGIDTQRTDLSLRLPPASTLLLYSDGLVETRTADLDHGLERLRSAARSLTTLGVAELCDALVSMMANPTSHDDVTLLAVRIPF
ncbi:MAG TPA: SpoIIE family protein phosphatase [Acidothermaceae bacterium]|nr:SpoIIE family protein phosphatase [Acidothermaceae bacterium]